jgi:GWxTD domain-containing protein
MRAGIDTISVLFVLLLAGCAAGGSIRETERGGLLRRPDEIGLDLDVALFRPGTGSDPLLHTHVSFPRSRLLFLRGEVGGVAVWRAEFEWRAIVRDRSGLQVGGGLYSREVVLEPGERPEDPAARVQVFQQLSIPPGRHRIEVTVEDRNSVRRGAQQRELEAFARPGDEPGLSDVELMWPDGVVPGETPGMAGRAPDRHAAEVLVSARNPDRAERLAFLFEAYRLPAQARIVYRLLDSEGTAVRSREFAGPRGSRVTVRDTLSTAGLREGSYELRITAEGVGARGLEQRRLITLQRPLLGWGEDYAATLSQLRLYAEPETVEAFSRLDPDERRGFLESVWKEMDPTADTERNEFRQEFERRLRYVEERWAAGGRRGWELDIGRIYVAYGEPDEVREGRRVLAAQAPLEDPTDARLQMWIYRDPPVSFTFIYEPGRGWVLSRDASSPIPPRGPAPWQ